MKIDRNFKVFIDFMSLELEVPPICLVTGGVSARRERRYIHPLSSAILFPLSSFVIRRAPPPCDIQCRSVEIPKTKSAPKLSFETDAGENRIFIRNYAM